MGFSKKEFHFFILIFLVAVFVLLRLSGLNLPYHQDEVKWAGIASTGFQAIIQIPHPPLGTILMVAASKLFGFDNLRYLPFIFGVINFWLLFYLVKYRFSIKASARRGVSRETTYSRGLKVSPAIWGPAKATSRRKMAKICFCDE